MATTNIMPAGTGAANSTDVTVTTAATTITMFPASGVFLPSGIKLRVLKLNSSATYTDTGLSFSSSVNSVTGAVQSLIVLTGPGVYRFQRPALEAGAIGIGVDMDQ